MTDRMFSDVVTPSITVGNRGWYTLSLSIVAHLAIVAVIAIAPFMAADLVPVPPAVISFMAAAPAPQPLTAPGPAGDRPIDVAARRGPSTIGPKRDADRDRDLSAVAAPSGVVNGPEEKLEPESPPPPPASSLIVLRVGGNIRPPSKVKDVKPLYPAIAQAARIEGIVIIEATIGPDGKIEGARVLRSIPLLDAAAVEAVRQWEYTPTLLNGSPVSLLMTVIVTFTLTS